MDFQIISLSADTFSHFFGMTDDELTANNAVRQVVTSSPGSPCRVSMQDAEIGETVLLLNYEHQPEDSPYKATHAIYVREHADQAMLKVNEVPDVIRRRLVSLRCFDRDHMMIQADVLEGEDLGPRIAEAFEDDAVAYAHIHNAKPGCFAASVRRVQD